MGRLQGAVKTGNLAVAIPFYAPDAVLLYHRMSRQLLKLYTLSNSLTPVDSSPHSEFPSACTLLPPTGPKFRCWGS